MGPIAVLHISSILPTHLEQRVRNLPERADAHGIHQHFEHIVVIDHRALKSLQHLRRLLGMALLEILQPLQLALLFLIGRAL
jgi:hypothetical protein